MCVQYNTVQYSAAISQMLPNYTNGTLNRWRMEDDLTRPSMSVTNIRTKSKSSGCAGFTQMNKTHLPVRAELCAYCMGVCGWMHSFVLSKNIFAA